MEQIKAELMRLKLSGMAGCLQTLEETRRVYELPLSDGLKLLIQSEKDQRDSNRYARLVKNAAFRYQASIEELSFEASRGVEQSKVLALATGEYIRKGEAVLITGAADCGKSFLASALGMQACRQGFTVIPFLLKKHDSSNSEDGAPP